MSSKAQISFMETIMVTFVVVVLLGIAIFFYFRVYGQSLTETGEELRSRESVILLATLASLPEIQCSTRAVEKPCVDALKVLAMKTLTQDLKDHYIPLLGRKTIRVEQLYPSVPLAECDVADFQQPTYPGACGRWTLYANSGPGSASTEILSTPISLYYPTVEQYAVAKLIVEVYA